MSHINRVLCDELGEYYPDNIRIDRVVEYNGGWVVMFVHSYNSTMMGPQKEHRVAFFEPSTLRKKWDFIA
jgi:hypothetical protein